MVVAGFTFDFFAACSFRDEFLAFRGILPVIYLAALPAPGFMGGSRRAVTEVERGMIVVSSSYSAGLVSRFPSRLDRQKGLTNVIFVVDRKVEICSITKTTLDDNITFELKYGDTGTIKFHSGRLFLGLKLEEYGGRHDVRCMVDRGGE